MGVAVFERPKRTPDADPEHGAKRGQIAAKNPPKPRVPIIGVDSGCIPGTMPSGEIGQGERLEQAGREIVRARLHRNRFKAAT